MAIDPALTYVLLNHAGTATQMLGGEAFWSKSSAELDAIGHGWLVSEYLFSKDWPNWEMHPLGDELVYLLEGEASLLLELPAGVQTEYLEGKGLVVVPKGIWHTAKTTVPCRMLHITMGQGTQSRPAAE
jgi:uncharacterized cupin superfamily protein